MIENSKKCKVAQTTKEKKTTGLAIQNELYDLAMQRLPLNILNEFYVFVL